MKKTLFLTVAVIGALALAGEATAIEADLFVQPPSSVPIAALADSLGRLVVVTTPAASGASGGLTYLHTGASGTTNATAAALAAVAAKTNYVCKVDITTTATAGAIVNGTLAGIVGGTMTFIHSIGTAGTSIGTYTRDFNPCFPASAANTAITFTSGAPGAGGVINVDIYGYQQ